MIFPAYILLVFSSVAIDDESYISKAETRDSPCPGTASNTRAR